jgi:putative ABC transport system permease protein
MSYNVSRQKREIGIRIALGAFPRTVLYAVLRDTFAIAAVGIVLGLVMALAATRALSTFLFDLSPRDPVALMAAAAVLLAVALVAGFVPARHAATVDPVRALRNE